VVALVNAGGSIDMRISPALEAFLTPEMRAGVRSLDPIARAAEFWPTAVLLLHGVNDETVPVAGARLLHGSLEPFYFDDPARLSLIEFVGIGHEFTTEQAVKSIEFVRNYL